ncbi:MAG: PIN domain nuclease [Chloroflexota bacterium]|nr:MAG: PIN domain nuclease [Chloroflexota bacterium]
MIPSPAVVLVDSSVWITLFRAPNRHVELSRRLDDLLDRGVVATNPLVRLEVLRGATGDREYARLSNLFDGLLQLPIDNGTWSEAIRLGFDLRRRGLIVQTTDLVVAASAIRAGAVLMHRDSDFDRVAAKTELLVESRL